MRWPLFLLLGLRNGRRSGIGCWAVACALLFGQVGHERQPGACFAAAPTGSPPPATSPDKEKSDKDKSEKSLLAEGPSVPTAPSGNSITAGPGATHAVAQEIKPEIFYFKDKEGKLIPVPGVSLESLLQMFRAQQLPDKPEEAKPRYSIQDIAIQGDVRGERANLAVTFRVKPQTGDWVRVPLRLNKSVLRELPKYSGEGEQFVEFDEGTGYVAWLRAKEGSEHRFTLQVATPVSSSRGGSRLDLSLPRAPTSQMTLKVPLPRAAAAVSEGASLNGAKSSGGETELNILGAAGDFHVAWREKESPALTVPVTLESVGALAIKFDERQITTDAAYTIRSLGGEFDSVQFRLPVDVRVSASNGQNYKVTTEVTESATLINVALDKKTTGPVDIRFVVERDYDVTKPQAAVELATIETVGAQRQFGHAAVQLPADWQLSPETLHGVRQTDDLPDALRKKGPAAGFEYFRGSGQAYAFSIRVAKRKTRLHVDPEYVFLVSGDHVELEGRLKYAIRGAKVARLEIDGGEWELLDVGPAAQFDVEEALGSDTAKWQFPFLAPTGGEVELSFRAQRKIAPGAARVEWSLPRPQADVLGPAVVVVVPDDHVELTPRPEELAGLSRQASMPTMAKWPDRHQPPLFFRGERSQAKFVADLQIHPQSQSVEVKTEIAANLSAIRVEQRARYQIQYVAADRVSLLLPKVLATNGSLEWYWDNQKLTPTPPRDATDPNFQIVSLLLPKPALGRGELLVRYSLPIDKLLPDAAVPVPVPLTLPAEGEMTSHELTLVPATGIQAEIRDDHWTKVRAESPPSPARVARFTSTLRDPQVEVILSPDESRGRDRAVVERAWVQTWFTTTQRQDRAVFQIRSAGGPLRLILPTGVVSSDVEVLLDEQAVPPVASPEEGLTVDLPVGREMTEHHLEVRYRFSDRRASRGHIAVELPHFAKIWVRRWYWQMILPKDEHLLAAPADWTSENVWGWRGFFWDRAAALEQVQLESWCGAIHQASPPQQTNRYLFSNLGTPPAAELVTAGRTLLVGVASFIVLMIGLLWLYVPAARRPAAGLVGALALLAVGLVYPESAWIVTQASGVGVLLVLVAVVLRKRMTPRSERSVIVRQFTTSTQTAMAKPPSGQYPSSSPSSRQAVSPQSPSAAARQTPRTESADGSDAGPSSTATAAAAPLTAPELPS